ncbi:hypothetical protein EUV02_04465 [Polymorphobacter arshaanensis]|uniref:PEP-CTERM sorting domain-containing protein n=1 Tax=Glacieibacterium arshaanense TaxID=2511025 RepID=A0A4Y9ES29_9SPHN|nr:hypothetical protein [Polymorphobacter arshaanensis]TFU06262.1 hypothetical protein EUV02_04465 [Polymorphobacter arshaanensis]
MGIMLRSVAVLTALLATPVLANIKIATFRSTLASGYDRAGLFGAPGTDLTGKEYTTVYRYDLAIGDHNPMPGVSELLEGRWQCNPILDVAVTINGISQHLPQIDFFDPDARGCDTYDHYYMAESYGAVEVGLTDYYSIARFSNYGWGQALIFNNVALKPMPTQLDFVSPTRRFTDHGGGFSLNLNGHRQADAYGTSAGAVKFSVRDEMPVVPGVPETAGWTMMLGGFAATGTVLRRRRATCPCAPSSAFS